MRGCWRGVPEAARWPGNLRSGQPVAGAIQAPHLVDDRAPGSRRFGLAARGWSSKSATAFMDDSEASRNRCICCTISACALRWTISGRAIRRSAICARFRSTRSRSISHLSATSRVAPIAPPSCGDRRARPQSRRRDHRRGCRDADASRPRARGRLHAGARLSVCRPADSRGDQGTVERQTGGQRGRGLD